MDGWATSLNLPPLGELPLDRFCNLIWHWATRNAEKESDVSTFEASLWQPPVGAEPRGPWSPEAENSAFAAFKTGLGM